MPYITQLYATANGQLVERLVHFEPRLNYVFTGVDDKLKEHADVVGGISNRVAQFSEHYQSLGQEVGRQEAECGSNLDRAVQQIPKMLRLLEETFKSQGDQLRTVYHMTAQAQADVQASRASSGEGSSSGGGLRVDRDKHNEDKESWEDWQDDLQEYLIRYYSKIKYVLEP